MVIFFFFFCGLRFMQLVNWTQEIELISALLEICLVIPRITYKFLCIIIIIIHAWPRCMYCPIAISTATRIPGSIVDIKPMEFSWPWHATEEQCASPKVGAKINCIFATRRDYMLPKIVVFGFAMDCKVQAWAQVIIDIQTCWFP